MPVQNQSRYRRARTRVREVVEAAHGGDTVSSLFDGAIVVLIIANVFAFVLETVDSIYAQFGPVLEVFNVVSVIIFTIEYVLRLWTCVELSRLRHLPAWKARLQFACRPMLIIDLLAILPFYLSVFFALDLRVLRVLRLLRFFKLARYSPALQTLGRVMASERRAFVGAGIVMLAMLLTASTVMYYLEHDAQPEVFSSVPAAAWWAIATLTTVGYGDVTPITQAGKIFGAVVMLFGLGMFALPIGILATGFAQEINRREFVVTWSMVVDVPLFSTLDAASIAKIVTQLRALSYPAGAIVLSEDDEIQSLHFVASGRVELQLLNRTAEIDAGDFFGESALLDRHTRYVRSAKALTRCDLLLLDRHDFEYLMKEHPEIRERVQEASVTRGVMASDTPEHLG